MFVETHQWDVSMVVDNVDYTTGMEKNMSREFTDLADTLCLGVSHEIYCGLEFMYP